MFQFILCHNFPILTLTVIVLGSKQKNILHTHPHIAEIKKVVLVFMTSKNYNENNRQL